MSGETEQPLRLLVVDDHPIWRDGVARDLAEAGLAVTGTAGDGAQALRVAAATRPQVVLLDLHLPDLPGGELIRRLLLVDASIRILVLSASGERQDVLDAMTAGATGYLVKSAQLNELLAAVRAVAKGDPVFTRGWPGWSWVSTGGWPQAGAPRRKVVPPRAQRPGAGRRCQA